MQRRVDRLEVVELRLVVEQQQRLGAEQRDRCQRLRRTSAGDRAKRRAAASGTSSKGTRKNGVHDEHQREHQGGASAGAGQVEAIDPADAVGVQHEAQADEQAGEEEERQQAA